MTTINGDSTASFGTYYDLVLFDPDWGGKEYMEGKKEEFDEFRRKILIDYNKTKTF